MARTTAGCLVLALGTGLLLTAPAGAQDNRVSGSEKGSLLIYPKVEVRWDAGGNLIQDTFVDLTNDYPDAVAVQMYFINGDPPLTSGGAALRAVGDQVHQITVPVPGAPAYCSIGVAFDGASLYYDRCNDANIYQIDPVSGALQDTFNTGIAEYPNALAYDITRNGLWIGAQACDAIGMPVYFWDFDDDSVTLMFRIPFGLINPATGASFLGWCFTDGLAFNANVYGDPTDDELWFSDDVNQNVGVFRPNGTFVKGFDATTVDPSLVYTSGLAVGGPFLYLANNGGGDVFRADLLTDPLVLVDQFTSGDERQEDMECDPITFAPTEVMWVRTTPQGGQFPDVITAFEIEPGSCGLGGAAERDHPGCNNVDVGIALTADEPCFWSAASGLPKGVSPWTILDPGDPPGRPDPDGSGERMLRGYIVAWAVDAVGEEIVWNHLKGDALIVNYPMGEAWEYNAFAFQAITGAGGAPPQHGDPTDKPCDPADGDAATQACLYLDGDEYDAGFDLLLLDFYAVGADIHPEVEDTDLTLLPISADLRQDNDGPLTTKAKFDIWNENEIKFSGTERCITCWDQTWLSDYDAPNHFLVENLHTDKGKARIDGLQSAVCPESTPESLLGLSMTQLRFCRNNEDLNRCERAQAGRNLVGMGYDYNGLIKADRTDEPPPSQPGLQLEDGSAKALGRR